MKREKSTYDLGDYELSVELVINDESRLHDYGIRRSAWFRGIRMMRRYGPDLALELLDERANRCYERKDIPMCYRLRDLMVAIHAMTEDEVQPNDRVH
ncbi:hypothetical protein ILFOPFJJ_06041 [Ensifer psoraleae]|uniref:hypothetical protein n=1 Tax=Sinorhizobium psoraleae TaxID=520838 RepID=UPI00156A3D8B|nr:hypothetical protein [Sinorhizobium psoraleae]NRP75118.1 hypothetical protein [Sinorhizobium psoraleae]